MIVETKELEVGKVYYIDGGHDEAYAEYLGVTSDDMSIVFKPLSDHIYIESEEGTIEFVNENCFWKLKED